MISTFRARRRQRIGQGWREPEELVPEAHLWGLGQTLIDVGELVRVTVSEEEFGRAVARFAPDDTEAIYAAAGLKPLDDDDEGTDRSKAYKGRAARGKPPIAVTEPEPLDT